MQKTVHYQVNSHDVCVQGFERLRTNDEFILVAYIAPGVTFKALEDALFTEIQVYARPDSFDYVACKKALGEWLESAIEPLYANGNINPFGLEDVEEDDGGADVNFFVYMQQTEDETVDA
jgi:hypothetical protein